MVRVINYNKSNLLNAALLGTALGTGVLAYSGSSPLERSVAEAGEVRTISKKFSDPLGDKIGDLIYDAIKKTQRGTSSRGYREAYESCEKAIDMAKNVYQSLSAKDPRFGRYQGFEIVAKMRQAKILREAGNNIIKPGEKISIDEIGELYPNAKINNGSNKYNLLKALGDYEDALRIRKQGIKLPSNVDHPQLASNGTVATVETILERMNEIIDTLVKESPEHSGILIEKKTRLKGMQKR